MTRLSVVVVPFFALLLLGCDPTRALPDAGCLELCALGGGGGCRSTCGGGGGAIDVAGGPGGGTGGGALTCGSTGLDDGSITADAAPPALAGGTMTVLRDGSFAIADADRARVWLVSADLQHVRTVALNAGDEPGRIVEGPDGHLFVALRRTSSLAELDVAAGTLARRLDTCQLPRGLAWRAADARLVVACLDGALELIDPLTAARTALPLPAALTDVRDVLIDGDKLLVTSFRAAQLWSVASDGTAAPLTLPPVPSFEPHVAWRAISRPGGGAALVRQQHRSVGFSTTNCASYGSFAKDTRNSGGGAGTTPSVVQSELLTVAPDTTAVATPLGSGLQAVVLPLDVAVSATGRVAVVSAGTGSVALLEPALRRDVVVTSAESDLPTSVVFRGESAFVFTRQPARLWEVRSDATVQLAVELGGPSAASTGHHLFHRATATGLACASCHPEAGEDGHVWPFFEGIRRTPTLRGGLGATKPFHWSGDLPTMASLMTAVMTTRMRGAQLSADRTAAVEDWLDGLPALPAPRVDEAAAARGKALFESERTACASCHAGAQGTDNQTVDVGTGESFQVPRLVELARRGPWLHDGRMATLAQRFELLAGAQHGLVADLTAAEREDLLEYLRSR